MSIAGGFVNMLTLHWAISSQQQWLQQQQQCLLQYCQKWSSALCHGCVS